MNAVIGDLLPLAVTVAISPVPVIATILMLLAPRAGATSAGFLLGWVAGIVVVTVVVTAIASTAGLDGASGTSSSTSWVKIVLGVLLILLAARQWRSRPRPGAERQLPKWMSAIETVTFGRATALGLLLSGLNPKNLLMCIAAGIAVGGAALSTGQDAVAIAVFTVIAASTVAIPVIGYAVARERMRGPLDELESWLQANNAAVMSVVLLVIGVVLLGKGIGGF